MSLKDSIVDKIIKPHADNKFDSCIGIIEKYDKYTNTASVLFKNPKNVGAMKVDNVPVFLNKGVSTISLKPQDEVYLTFVNGSIMQPIITGSVDKTYMVTSRVKQRHNRKGSLVTDKEYDDLDITDIYDMPSIEYFIDEENEDFTKYSKFTFREPSDDLINEFSDIGYFKDNEVGIYHPIVSSIVKLRDNGCIDIFTSSNQGLRINPNSRSIKFLTDDINFVGKNWYIESESFSFKGNEFTIESNTINLISNNLNIDNKNVHGE